MKIKASGTPDFILHRVRDGVEMEVARNNDIIVNQGETHRVAVQAIGDEIIVLFDDEEVAGMDPFVDDDPILEPGRIGVGQQTNPAYYDNITICCAGERPPCPEAGQADFADTHCTGITIEGADGNLAGVFKATIDAVDDSGDDIKYKVKVTEKGNPNNSVVANRTGDGEYEFRLRAGTWRIEVTVDDDRVCDDAAADSTCVEEIEVEARPAGPIDVEQLAGLWLFDDGDGNIAEDSSGNDNIAQFFDDGTTTWVEGEFGDALDFDGSGNYAIVLDPGDGIFDFGDGDFTIGCWMKSSNLDAYVVIKRNGGNFWALSSSIDRNSGLFIFEGPGVHIDTGQTVIVGDDTWHHCVAVRRDGEVSLYVDGELDTMALIPDTMDNPAQIQFGGWGSENLIGGLDEVFIFQRDVALTQEQIQCIMDQGWERILETDGAVCTGEMPPPSFLRGDCNKDDAVNLADAVCTLNWLFGGGAGMQDCVAALNTNGDATVNLTDPVSVLNFLFAGGPGPVEPFPECGPGTLPADEQLGCANSPDCQ